MSCRTNVRSPNAVVQVAWMKCKPSLRERSYSATLHTFGNLGPHLVFKVHIVPGVKRRPASVWGRFKLCNLIILQQTSLLQIFTWCSKSTTRAVAASWQEQVVAISLSLKNLGFILIIVEYSNSLIHLNH